MGAVTETLAGGFVPIVARNATHRVRAPTTTTRIEPNLRPFANFEGQTNAAAESGAPDQRATAGHCDWAGATTSAWVPNGGEFAVDGVDALATASRRVPNCRELAEADSWTNTPALLFVPGERVKTEFLDAALTVAGLGVPDEGRHAFGDVRALTRARFHAPNLRRNAASDRRTSADAGHWVPIKRELANEGGLAGACANDVVPYQGSQAGLLQANRAEASPGVPDRRQSAESGHRTLTLASVGVPEGGKHTLDQCGGADAGAFQRIVDFGQFA